MTTKEGEQEKEKIKRFSPAAPPRLGLHFQSTSGLAIGCLSPTSKEGFHWLQRAWETALCFPIYSTRALRVKEQGRKIAADYRANFTWKQRSSGKDR